MIKFKEKTIKVHGDAQNSISKIHEPLILRDDGRYYCILGIDYQTCIYGHGDSLPEAMQVWDNNLKEYLKLSA